jgi:transposase
MADFTYCSGEPMKVRRFTGEFREEAVRLVEVEGLSISAAAKDLGISKAALYKWVCAHRNRGAAAFSGCGNLSPEEQKIRELERKLQVAEMERDILKKATAFFARNSH